MKGLVVGVSGENSVGYRIVRHLRELGAEVAATYRPARREACAQLLDGVALHAPLELGDEGSLEAAFRHVGHAFGRLDFLVHTTMQVPPGLLARPLLSVTRDELAGVIDVGAYSLIELCRHAEPWLLRSADPRVVTLTSALAERTAPNYHVAGIAKAALGATLRYLAAELGPRGILCNAVSFSLVDTDGARAAVGPEVVAPMRSLLARRSLTRAAADADDVAGTVAFLASPACRNMTGEILSVDGGYAKSYV